MPRGPARLLALVLASLGSLAAAASPRPLIIAHFRPQESDDLAKAAREAGFPRGTPIYFGAYGVNPAIAAMARSIPGGVYAPLIAPQSKYFPVRRLRPEETAKLTAGHEKYAGAMPFLLQQKDARGKVLPDPATGKPSVNMPPAEQHAWGVEMGKRLRDEIRHNSAAGGFAVTTFQLDEVVPSASKTDAAGVAVRMFFRGVLDGGHSGRPVLGDKPMKAIVHVAHTRQLFSLPTSAEANHFMKALDQASSHVVIEAYPDFKGGVAGAKAAAARFMAPKALLGRWGAVGASLSRKLVVGGTPGAKHGQAIGGYVSPPFSPATDAWRKAFIEESLRLGSWGFSEYSWTPEKGHTSGGNTNPHVIKATFAALASAFGGGKPAPRAAAPKTDAKKGPPHKPAPHKPAAKTDAKKPPQKPAGHKPPVKKPAH